MADTVEVMQRLGSTFDEMLLATPDSVLREAVGSMSMNDWDTPVEFSFADMSPLQRAKWLNSQTFTELAKWSVRLEPDDRREWLSWLKSPNGQIEIEMALAESAKSEAPKENPGTD